MTRAFAVAVTIVLLGIAQVARATPSTVLWTPATAYTQPFLVPHLTYDSYVAERSFVPNDYGLTMGVSPSEKLQAEVGLDLFQPGKAADLFQINGKVTLAEGAYASWQPGVSLGVMNVGFKKDVSDYDLFHLDVAKTFKFGTLAVGGYYGAGSDVLWTGSDGNVNRTGFMGSYVSPDLTVNRTGLQKLNLVADFATGKNWFGAAAAGLSVNFTPAIDIITGPVWFLDGDLAKGIYGSSVVWTVQLDVDFDLHAPKQSAAKS